MGYADAIRSTLEGYEHSGPPPDRTLSVAIARRSEQQLVEAVEQWCIAKQGAYRPVSLDTLAVETADTYYAAQDDIRGDGRGVLYIALFSAAEVQ